jgi:hypothetical protein
MSRNGDRSNRSRPKVPRHTVYAEGILHSQRLERICKALRTMPDEMLEDFLEMMLYTCRERRAAALIGSLLIPPLDQRQVDRRRPSASMSQSQPRPMAGQRLRDVAADEIATPSSLLRRL